MSQPFTPKPYQYIAAKFMRENLRCNLWAVPGLGKTSAVYMVIDIMQLAGSTFFPALVLAPKKVCDLTWPAEQRKWDAFKDIRVVPILGERDARDAALLRRGDVFVINYDNIQWLVDSLGDRWPFKTVVADESTRLKNFRLNGGGKRTKALSMIAGYTKRWINLSGTPVPNGLKDLWGQLWFIDQGSRLGRTHTDFMRRWFYVNPYDRSITPTGSAHREIYEAVADVSLALRAEDWLDIQQPHELPREIDLPPDARRLYDQMENEFFMEVGEEGIHAPNAAALSMKLLQIASGAVYDGSKKAHFIHDAKIEALRSIMNEMGGEPLLVAYWFKFEPPMLKAAFPEFRLFQTAQDEKDWNGGRIQLMGIHPASAGHGTNLQYGGRAMAHLTHTWDLELRQQVCERIGPVRQKQAGLDRAVLHYNLIARNTLDVEVLERQASKRSVQDALMLARAHRRGDSPWSDLL